MIQVKSIKCPTILVYDPDDNLLGALNEYEFLDLRVQIKINSVSGYYCKFNDDIIKIGSNGELSHYPIGFFDAVTDMLLRLL